MTPHYRLLVKIQLHSDLYSKFSKMSTIIPLRTQYLQIRSVIEVSSEAENFGRISCSPCVLQEKSDISKFYSKPTDVATIMTLAISKYYKPKGISIQSIVLYSG